eukprot:s2747_g1.t1
MSCGASNWKAFLGSATIGLVSATAVGLALNRLLEIWLGNLEEDQQLSGTTTDPDDGTSTWRPKSTSQESRKELFSDIFAGDMFKFYRGLIKIESILYYVPVVLKKSSGDDHESIVYISGTEEQFVVVNKEALQVSYVDLVFNRNSKTSQHWGDLVADCCTTTLTKYLVHNCKYAGIATELTDVDNIGKVYQESVFCSFSWSTFPNTKFGILFLKIY